MATLKNGANGGFSGKVGSVVGASWREIEYIRSLPSKRQTPPKSDEKNNRTKFGFGQLFLRPFAPFFSIGLMNFSGRMTAYNAALSFLLNEAMRGEAPDFEVHIPSLVLSEGRLEGAMEPAVAVRSPDVLQISWKSRVRRKAKNSDDLLFIAYSEELENSFWSIGDAVRASGCLELQVPQLFQQKHLHCFMAFSSRDRRLSSRSQYLGKIDCSGE